MGVREAGACAVLKSDVFGRVERWDTETGPLVRRVPAGSRVPLSAFLARRLAARERDALLALAGLRDVPALVDAALPAPPVKGEIVREHLAGAPLSQAAALPADFFDHLAELARACHARGVCHNDLHKEQNVLVRPDGRPALIDFQLASCHRHRDRRFAARAREDLRHVEKHRQRYVRQGRTRAEAGLGPLPPRGTVARWWRRWGKPVYLVVSRRVFGWRDGEPRRSSAGPWPRWDPPLGALDAHPRSPPAGHSTKLASSAAPSSDKIDSGWN